SSAPSPTLSTPLNPFISAFLLLILALCLPGWVKFIDYEYSSYNYQAFDIGNHFNEFAGVAEVDYSLYPDKHFQLQWLTTYLEAYKRFTKKGSEVTNDEVHTLFVQVNKFALASHFFWGFWALIQAKYSTIEFDFLG
ncbi:ethanolamine kinase 1, partial [Callorhinchus milii]|uniref:ethanolamine kinase 1 n=1 Tax=Callorhinchus milii TaxID=7868 RepID=UPI001C3FE996